VSETTEPLLEVSVDESGDFTVVTIEGEVEFATAPRLRGILLDLARAGAARVVLDLSGVSFLDSAGLSLLIQAKKRLANGDSDLVLRAPRENVRRVLEISGVSELFEIES
jgi:anti-sigma B factor antagonist